MVSFTIGEMGQGGDRIYPKKPHASQSDLFPFSRAEQAKEPEYFLTISNQNFVHS
jgi:hypothetical protein